MRPIDDKLRQICRLFRIPGNLTSWEEIKVGNVNRTYKVTCRQDGGRAKSYIVQRINTYAFRQPVLVMENIDKVTEHIRAKCPDRVALHFHHTADRKNYVSDEDGFWRLFNYVPSVTYNTTENLSVIRSAGEAFGDFQTQLGDFDVQQLHYTIPDFHDTRKRYAKLKEDAAADPQGRAGQAREEIDWLLSVEDRACALTDLYDRGELPLRVTHNDFGDAIRFAANYVEEDSPETERAGVNMAVFRAFTEGFLKQTASTLTEREIDTLALSCFALACELATRFLGDYLLRDPYFKIDYPEHNLVRTRCQIALARDMLEKLPEMEEVVRSCAEKYRGTGAADRQLLYSSVAK